MKPMRRGIGIVAVFAAAFFCFGVAVSAYGSLDELPEPDYVFTDPAGDAENVVTGRRAAIGWYDIREVQSFITDSGIGFAVFCYGNIPADEILLVLIDVDGTGGGIGSGMLNRQKCYNAGYDYGLGMLGSLGLFRVTTSWDWPSERGITHWRDGRVAYFEVSWDQLGGRPEAIALLVVTEGRSGGSYAQDIAPNRGVEIFDIVASTPVSLLPDVAFETGFQSMFLDPDWRWVREDQSHWTLGARLWSLSIMSQAGSLLGSENDARNVLLRDAPEGDFDITTFVEFAPSANYHFAGLIVYEDDDNFIALGRSYCGATVRECLGNGIYFDCELRGGRVGGNFRTALGSGEAHLRISRRGSSYYGYYSEDGVEWGLIGVHEAVGLDPNEVGLYVGGDTEGAPEIMASFAEFEIRTGEE